MSSIKLAKFGGLIPRLSVKLLPSNAAQKAHNCRLKSGRLEPLLQPAEDTRTGSTVSSSCKTIYLWRHGETISDEQWLSWNDYVSVVPSPIADDDKYRIWIAGKTRADDAVEPHGVMTTALWAVEVLLNSDDMHEYFVRAMAPEMRDYLRVQFVRGLKKDGWEVDNPAAVELALRKWGEEIGKAAGQVEGFFCE